MPGGRPSSYTPETAEFICARIASGESMVSICADADMPAQVTVYSWLSKFPEFAKRYACAREEQAEKYASEIIAIADENPTCTVPDPDGGVSVRVDAAAIQRNKLRVDARKWIACKLLPKVYGDKQQISGDPEAPIGITIVSSIPRPER